MQIQHSKELRSIEENIREKDRRLVEKDNQMTIIRNEYENKIRNINAEHVQQMNQSQRNSSLADSRVSQANEQQKLQQQSQINTLTEQLRHRELDLSVK